MSFDPQHADRNIMNALEHAEDDSHQIGESNKENEH